LCLLKSIQMAFMFGFGISTALEIKFHQAYGNHIKTVGIGLSLASVFGAFNMWLGLKGSLQHNKFILTLHAVFDAVSFILHMYLGSEILFVTIPEFEDSLRLKCSENDVRPLDPVDDCRPYVQSVRTSGFQMVWRSYYYESGRDPNFFQKVIDVQRDGQCCGFGPPQRCYDWDPSFPHNNKFDASFYYTGTSTAAPGSGDWAKYSTVRQICAPPVAGATPNENWYPSLPLSSESTSDSEPCDQIIDDREVPPRYGGCRYDFPLGTCKDLEVGIYNGCMYALENTMNAELAPPSLVILGLSVFQTLGILAACCFCWKRKQHDTFPDTLSNVPYDPFKNAKVDIAGALERKIHRPEHEKEGIEFMEET